MAGDGAEEDWNVGGDEKSSKFGVRSSFEKTVDAGGDDDDEAIAAAGAFLFIAAILMLLLLLLLGLRLRVLLPPSLVLLLLLLVLPPPSVGRSLLCSKNTSDVVVHNQIHKMTKVQKIPGRLLLLGFTIATPFLGFPTATLLLGFPTATTPLLGFAATRLEGEENVRGSVIFDVFIFATVTHTHTHRRRKPCTAFTRTHPRRDFLYFYD